MTLRERVERLEGRVQALEVWIVSRRASERDRKQRWRWSSGRSELVPQSVIEEHMSTGQSTGQLPSCPVDKNVDSPRDSPRDDVAERVSPTPPSQRGISNTSTPNINKHKNKKTEVLEFTLPDWMPQKEWEDYCSHRLLIRKPIKSFSQAKYCVEKLEKLRANGHDPARVLAQSIENGWQGIFGIREDFSGGISRGKTVAEQTRENAAIALQRARARAASAGGAE